MALNQLLNCSSTATGLNLSHSSPFAAPPVALVCPVEVCPIRRMVQCPAGAFQTSRPLESISPERSIILRLSIHNESAICAVVVGKLTLHISPFFPSY